MLQLFGIKKDYPAGAGVVHALRGIDLSFRRSEFVSILGPSGCGKTTLLNIIGGLDGYTEGDLVINGVSTKEYKDRDWDAYRNHSVGFVFQTYNLIPHQTVLQNVELSLTLAGISPAERRERARAALEKVGLSDQINKLPRQLSGGQMQRVAIARALVNEPDIILADEPTGALDTETSVQVMEILKKVSEQRLVVMVTHNPELADAYSTRIIRMLDGVIISDSSPLSDEEIATETARLAEEEALLMAEEEPPKKAKKAKKVKKPSMSFATSFMLSLKNLFTKKGRTTLTAFAGSIGIIGIALILSVSQGMTAYIDHVQETTLSAYPLTLESQTVDMTAMLESFMNQGSDVEHEKDAVYKDPVIGEMVNALAKLELSKNDLAAFKTHLEAELVKPDSPLKEAISGIQYTYGIAPIVYTKNQNGDIIKSDTGELMMEMIGDFMIKAGTANSDLASSGSVTANPMMSGMMGMQMWQELLPGLADGDPINDMLEEQYNLVHGAWPNDKNEIVLVLNEKNELDDLTLYALGLLSREEIDAIIDAAASGTELPVDNKKWSYEEICAMTFRAVMPYDRYKYSEADGIYVDVSENQNMLGVLYESAMELRVVGIIRPNEDAEVAMLTGAIGYTHLLTEHVVTEAANAPVIKAQLASPTVDVLTGLPFETSTGTLTSAEKQALLLAYLADLKPAEAREVYTSIKALDAEADPQMGASVLTEMTLANMNDKQALIKQVSQVLAAQSGMDPAMVEIGLKDKNLGELKEMLRPALHANFLGELSKAADYSLQTLVDMFFASPEMNDKEALVSQISETIAKEMGVDASMVADQLGDLSLEELKQMLRPFIEESVKTQIRGLVAAGLTSLDDAQIASQLSDDASKYTTEQCVRYYDEVVKFSDATYEERLAEVGSVNLDSPATINLFATTFENKDLIVDTIARYNDSVDEAKKISYTDFLGIMMSSITTIINAITYVLIAFVAISLVVSSIMIGVITLISVQERTKEIGILRAIGASKKDVSGLFNAETVIIGFASGLLGVLVTYLLCIPINLILYALTDLANLKAFLPLPAALILIAISVILTLFSGLIPSRSAAKRDPVVALRTE